jgi:hypothetical protein
MTVPVDSNTSNETEVSQAPAPSITLGSYAQKRPPIISLWTIVASLAAWTNVVSNDVLLAQSTALAQLSKLANKDNDELNAQLAAINTEIQNVDPEDSNASNQMSQYQSDYSTQQTAWGVPVSNDQGAMTLVQNSINSTNQGEETILGMMQSLVNMSWQVKPL